MSSVLLGQIEAIGSVLHVDAQEELELSHVLDDEFNA